MGQPSKSRSVMHVDFTKEENLLPLDLYYPLLFLIPEQKTPLVQISLSLSFFVFRLLFAQIGQSNDLRINLFDA